MPVSKEKSEGKLPSQSSGTVRSLERGLEILRFLQQGGGATLHELHQQLGLAKPTLLRLLATLETSGFAWQGLVDRRYHASNGGWPMVRRDDARDHLAEVAGPVLDWLVDRAQWPSDLSVRRGSAMQLRETSRQRSYFQLLRLKLGFRINMLLSAPGRAWLAFCSQRERETVLAQLRRSDDPGLRLLGSDAEIAEMIEATRRRGYGIRDARWGGHIRADKQESDDGLMAIAVPIIAAGKVLGCVNIVWIARLLPTKEIARLHLDDLKEAAQLIALRYEGKGKAT